MDTELLCLKWNHHNTTFLHIVGSLRNKALFTDATIACEGKLYQVHRLVLSSCSEYFSAIFENIPCTNPVIILKDITCKNLESLLDYMYLGEVNIRQNELDDLITSAECLRIKGLAAPDIAEQRNPKFRSFERSFSPLPKKRKLSEDIVVNSAVDCCLNDNQDEASSPVKVEPPDNLPDIEFPTFFRSHLQSLENSDQLKEAFDPKLDIKEEESDSSSNKADVGLALDTVAGPSGLQNNNLNLTISTYTNLFNKMNSSRNQYQSEEQTLILRQWLEHLARIGGCNKLTCPLCGKVCSRSDKLKLHLRIHTGERPYCCHYCQHRSRTSDDLKRHIRTHTGERPYQCPFCVYRASDPSTIRSHKKYRHPQLFKASLANAACTNSASKLK